MLIHRIVSDFEFDKIKVAEMVKKRDNVAEESLTQKDVIYFFMNSMANDIKYFASRMLNFLIYKNSRLLRLSHICINTDTLSNILLLSSKSKDVFG